MNNEYTFVIDLLTTLRQERFRPRAWVQFFQASWLRSSQTARANPELTRSWRRITLFIATLALLILFCDGLAMGLGDGLRLLPCFALLLAYQQSDLFWHLGLNRSVLSGRLLPTIGVATTLTLSRGLLAAYLLARLLSGLPVAAVLALPLFLIACVTDILDGQIARSSQTSTRLGQILDGETDFCLYLALTLVLLSNGALPLWVGLIMLLRFLLPLLAALASYLVFARPVRFGSTTWGKLAGLAQTSYFLVLLIPSSFAAIVAPLKLPLLIVTLGLLILAPLAQVLANSHPPT